MSRAPVWKLYFEVSVKQTQYLHGTKTNSYRNESGPVLCKYCPNYILVQEGLKTLNWSLFKKSWYEQVPQPLFVSNEKKQKLETKTSHRDRKKLMYFFLLNVIFVCVFVQWCALYWVFCFSWICFSRVSLLSFVVWLMLRILFFTVLSVGFPYFTNVV